MDASNGYDAIADRYIATRSPRHGVAIVRDWARNLPEQGSVLDLGCGDGVPISKVLIDSGLDVYGIDASSRMVAAFRARYRDIPVVCEPAESSDLFGRQFDGIVAVGLLFLLTEQAQRALINRVGFALRSKGRFLFTAPRQPCEWKDAMTGLTSRSLGSANYANALRHAGLSVVSEYTDEGQNHYYDALRHQ